MTNLLETIIDAVINPPQKLSEFVEADADGNLYFHKEDNTPKITLSRILKLAKSEKGKKVIRRYAEWIRDTNRKSNRSRN